MTIYIALLRAINVGGKNKIKMEALRHMLEAMGLHQVQTYIQTGNVLFESSEEAEPLRIRIEQEIKAVFDLDIAVIMRTAAELEQILQNCPFSEAEILKAEATAVGESLYVALLSQAPLQEKVERLKGYASEGDAYQVIGRDVYLLFKDSIRTSKVAINLQKLEVPATVRNWKTLNKLRDLASS